MELLTDVTPLPDSSRAISMAIENGDLEGLQKVIGLADTESNTLMGGNPLMFASVMGQADIVKWLLEAGCEINAQDENNMWTALMQAVFHGHYRVVEYLLSAGADPEIGNTDGLNSHSIATMLNDEYMSELLVKHCRTSGKKWWAKLTTKFSTIRALTAFKSRLKVEGDVKDEECDEEKEEKEKQKDEKPKEEENANVEVVENEKEEKLVDEGAGPSSSPEEESDLSINYVPPDATPISSHLIHVKPVEKVDTIAEGGMEEVDTGVELITEEPDQLIVSPTRQLVTSPDSGFNSRPGADSIPLGDTPTEYDGLDVDVPDLPDDIQVIEPDYNWYPENVHMDEGTLRAMGAEEDVIGELKKLNVVM